MEDQIRTLAQDAILKRVFPGCAIGVVRSGTRTLITEGTFTYDASPKVAEDSLFDVASITKSIPTASLALQLIDEGKLDVADHAVTYLPELKNPDSDKILIKHLLTYTVVREGSNLSTFKDLNYKELAEHIFTQPFTSPPGTTFGYSNFPAFLMGLIVERVHGKTLDSLADEHFFKPLKMYASTFNPKKNGAVPTEVDDWRGLVQGVVHDESAYLAKTKANKVVGHAGLFSTAPDLLNFLEMLLNKGEWQGTRYFSTDIIEQMGTNQISELGDSTGLGWELNQPRFMGSKCGPHTFGKTGFTGTLAVCDVERGVAYVILTNRIYPKRPADSSAINSFRAAVGDVVWAR